MFYYATKELHWIIGPCTVLNLIGSDNRILNSWIWITHMLLMIGIFVKTLWPPSQFFQTIKGLHCNSYSIFRQIFKSFLPCRHDNKLYLQFLITHTPCLNILLLPSKIDQSTHKLLHFFLKCVKFRKPSKGHISVAAG